MAFEPFCFHSCLFTVHSPPESWRDFPKCKSTPSTKALPRLSSAVVSNQTPAHSSKPGPCPPPSQRHHLICASLACAVCPTAVLLRHLSPDSLLCHRAFAHLFLLLPQHFPQVLSRLQPLVLQKLLHKCDFLGKAFPLLSPTRQVSL